MPDRKEGDRKVINNRKMKKETPPRGGVSIST